MGRGRSILIILATCIATFFCGAAQARFLQVDPIGFQADPNAYAYVGNDPTDRTDPSGQCPMDGCPTTDDFRAMDVIAPTRQDKLIAAGVAIGLPVVAAGAAACAGSGACAAAAAVIGSRAVTGATIGAGAGAIVSAAKGNSPQQIASDAATSAVVGAGTAVGGPAAPLTGAATSIAVDVASGKSTQDTIVDAVATAAGARVAQIAGRVGAAPALSSAARAAVTKPVSTAVSEGIKALGTPNSCGKPPCPQ
jgi:hypothetical protein